MSPLSEFAKHAPNDPGWEPDWSDPTSAEVERWQLECAGLARLDCEVSGHWTARRLHQRLGIPDDFDARSVDPDVCLQCGERIE